MLRIFQDTIVTIWEWTDSQKYSIVSQQSKWKQHKAEECFSCVSRFVVADFCMCLVQLLVAHVLHVQQIPCKITCRTDCVKLTRRKAFLVLLKPYYDFDSFQITKYSNVQWQPTQSLGAWVNSASAFAFLHQTPCSSTFWSYGTWACCSNWELRPNADHLKAYFSQCD